VHTLPVEPESLDPALSTGSSEFWVIPALLEGLTQYHPRLPQPMAALATHYEVSADAGRFTFYLRGHSSPRGTALPNGDSLPEEFTRGRRAAPDGVPARWSDGRILTAHDFVYSWRRFLHPKTAGPMAYQLYYVLNAEEINTGQRHSDELGVRALDDFTFQVDLRSPTPFFLHLITQYIFSPVPSHAVEATRQPGNESSWTQPGKMISSGPFLLKEWRRYELISAVRNPLYYDSGMVDIEELCFTPVADGTTAVNLYKVGEVAAMPGVSFPYLFIRAMGGKRDFHTEPAFGVFCPVMSVQKPPLDNVLLRFALNMATEKQAFCDVLGGGRLPARNVVASVPGYRGPESVMVEIDGRPHNVLKFDPEGARAMLAKAGIRSLEITFHFPQLPESTPRAEMLRQQWQRNLGIRLKLAPREFNVHWSMVLAGEYSGVADYAFLPLYYDPNPFLDPFMTPGEGNPSGWTDKEFRSMLAEANRTLDRADRMTRLAACEERLLRNMPLIPIYFDAWAYLRKPFVRGLTSNLFDTRAFKYAWIDREWRTA
jgi:oligopeptide transport system substrate-binding protein